MIEDESIVENAEPVAINRFQQAWVPNDSLFSNQWHLHAERDQAQLLAAASVNATEASEISRGERSIRLCCMDDGFYLI
jgi:hypothetical protein